MINYFRKNDYNFKINLYRCSFNKMIISFSTDFKKVYGELLVNKVYTECVININ